MFNVYKSSFPGNVITQQIHFLKNKAKMPRENRRVNSAPSRKFQVEKVKNSVRRWKDAMILYSNHAEKEYSKIKALVKAGRSLMTDSELKMTYKLLSK